MKNITKKEQVLRFVEAKGSARFTEIQEFIYDINYGEGAYKKGYQIVDEHIWNAEAQKHLPAKRKMNTNRGYYCSAFRQISISRFTKNLPVGYFMRGDNRLEKMENGSYITIRG
jgi:hypothetical protein